MIESGLKISRILHAGYVFECDPVKIAFDPIFENPFSHNCHAFPAVEFDHKAIREQNFQAVFISHFHDDHCSFDSLNLLDRKTPIFMFCVFEEMLVWIRELGFINVHPLKLDEPVKVGPFVVTARRALDEDVDSVFHIQAAGLNILNVVDSWIDDPTLALLAKTSPWDLVLWPFQTMREIEVISPRQALIAPTELPHEWLEQLKSLAVRYIVPSSCQFQLEPWSWYNQAFFPISYSEFQRQIEASLPQAKVIRLNPSVSIFISKTSVGEAPPLSWVHPVGPQDVEYHYDPNLVPPPSSEVAKKFSSLSKAQTQRVLEYCQTGLPEKFRSLEASEDPFFAKSRIWLLRIWDHLGHCDNYFYQLDRSKIEPITTGEPEWLTEVSSAKIWAALENGESLTSMYLRINDQAFTEAIEMQIAEADIVEDPLIRCLFTGAFGTYQQAQLKKLILQANSK